MKTKKQVIQDLLKTLDNPKRGTETITTCQNTSPLYPVIQEMHNGTLPHNWIFEKTQELLIFLLNQPNELHEAIDSSVDIYNYDLIHWSKAFYNYVDDARERGLINQNTDFISQLMSGQYVQLQEMAGLLEQLINELQEASNE